MVRETLALNQPMNSANLSPITQIKERLHIIIGTVLGLAGAIAGGLFAVGYGGNPVKSLMLLTGVVTMVVATLRPKTGLHLLILSSAFLDLIKRMLLAFGMSSMSDVTGVLAVSPMILVGTFFGVCVLHPIFTKRMLDQGERRLALGALLLIGISMVLGFREATSIIELLGNTANQAAYSLLVPIVYILYRRNGIREIEGLLRFTALIYIPVAAYGVFQFWFGYSQFEVDYLRSGLTTITANLYDLHPRPFSTLNSPHAYSTLMWFMAVTTIGLGFQRTDANRAPRWLAILYIASLLLSFVRGAIVFAIANIFMGRWLKTRKGTITFHVASLVTLALVVGFSQMLLDHLEWFQRYLPGDSDWQVVAFRLGTISDRLQGYQSVLLNPRMYTLFGHGVSSTELNLGYGEEGFSHDLLSATLYRFGIVGVLLILSVGGFILWRIHRAVWRTPDRDHKALGGSLLAIFVLILISHIGGASYHVFPINLFMWLYLGLAITVCAQAMQTTQRLPTADDRAKPRLHATTPAIARREAGRADPLPDRATRPSGAL